uniref:Uncharacterized protein n=1 Tax=Tanacetum cinerariifolium TaxID=118510 RepID=A0A6L2M0F3_TANCI|nr:hypothetical protein [Tanacetum cinerariifolium]
MLSEFIEFFIKHNMNKRVNTSGMKWDYFVNGMLFNLIKNLYALFGIPSGPKQYYKDGDYARMLQRPRHQYLRYEGLQYTDPDIADFETRLARDAHGQSVFTSQAWRQLFDIRGPLVHELILEFFSTFRLIGCSTAGRSQAPKKEEVGAMISGSQFVARLAEHCALLIEETLRVDGDCARPPYYRHDQGGKAANMHELDDTWAWVPIGPARQEGEARGVAKEALMTPGVGAEDEEMPQAMPPPPRNQGKRIAILEEEVRGIHEALQGQREVLDSMACDFSRFTTWTITSLAQLMDSAGLPYMSYSESPVEYQRRTRQRTDNVSTSPCSRQPDA